MSAPVMLVAVIAAIGTVYVLLPVAIGAYLLFRRPRAVACPETGLVADVQVDAWHAAATAVPGPPRLYVADCSRWPARAKCEQRCVAHAAVS